MVFQHSMSLTNTLLHLFMDLNRLKTTTKNRALSITLQISNPLLFLSMQETTHFSLDHASRINSRIAPKTSSWKHPHLVDM